MGGFISKKQTELHKVDCYNEGGDVLLSSESLAEKKMENDLITSGTCATP